MKESSALAVESLEPVWRTATFVVDILSVGVRSAGDRPWIKEALGVSLDCEFICALEVGYTEESGIVIV